MKGLVRCAAAIAAVAAATGAAADTKPPDLIKLATDAITWRSIGPAGMGGRVSDIAVDPKNASVIYCAQATGGLMKSENNGVSWTGVFDKQKVASIGAVAVAPTNSNIVWVGTGEANGRNSSSWGDGVYKSTDAGKTWTHMGLDDSQEIGRIVIDPTNPDIVFVAATGHLWGANRERGLYRTEDAGKTWKQVLSVDENTGCIDVALGAPGSGVVLAAMYQRRRHAYGFDGHGPGSGIYRSTDGGTTFKKVTAGLPAGSLGRIGLAVSGSDPDIAYAVVESGTGGGNLFDNENPTGGTFRSDDAGATWKRTSGNVPRGFYFGQIRVDPTKPDHVFVLGFNISESTDGAKTWKGVGNEVHSDLHAMWIEPSRPNHILVGCDGGIYVSYDGAKSFGMMDNIASGEFYEVAVDNRVPYYVYGGLQDNSAWFGPSAKHDATGPNNYDWTPLVGGDGFYCIPDPQNPDIVYSEMQNAGLNRLDRRTNIRKNFQPTAPEGQPTYRFNWDAALAIDPFDTDSVYVGGSHVFRWFNKGTEWESISPDLSKQQGTRITTQGSGAETYGTVVQLACSTRQKGLIWAGTDDGNVQLTQDGGKTWTDLTGNLPADVRDMYVKRIEASGREPGRAYLAMDGHRNNEFQPHLFVTEDFGKTWRSISSDLPAGGPVKAIREDPVNSSLLFAGTEFGAFASWDRGGHWTRINGNLPTVAVDDLAIQPRDHALVAGTHGRSIWIEDNISVLEELTPDVLTSDAHLFSMPPAFEWYPAGFGWFGGSDKFIAPNPPQDVRVSFWQKNISDAAATITIADAKGKTIKSFTSDRLPGLKSVTWNMREDAGPSGPPMFGFTPPPPQKFVPAGDYKVTLTVDKVKQTKTIHVNGDPELATTSSDDVGGLDHDGGPRQH